MKALLPVSKRLLEIEQEIIEAEGQVSDAQEQELGELLADLGRAIVNRELGVEQAKELKKKISDWIDLVTIAADTDRARMAKSMQHTATPTVRDDYYTASIVNGKGRVVITNEQLIPDFFWAEETIIKRKPDLDMIRVALEGGREVDGAELVKEAHVRIVRNKERIGELLAEREARDLLS